MRPKFIYESLTDLLKPKSKEEIINVFDSLNVCKQCEFLYAGNLNLISFNKWPLIFQIKEKIKNTKYLDLKYRVTSITMLEEFGFNKSSCYFRVYNRESNMYIIISQINNDKFVYLNNNKIYSYKDFKDKFLKLNL